MIGLEGPEVPPQRNRLELEGLWGTQNGERGECRVVPHRIVPRKVVHLKRAMLVKTSGSELCQTWRLVHHKLVRLKWVMLVKPSVGVPFQIKTWETAHLGSHLLGLSFEPCQAVEMLHGMGHPVAAYRGEKEKGVFL